MTTALEHTPILARNQRRLAMLAVLRTLAQVWTAAAAGLLLLFILDATIMLSDAWRLRSPALLAALATLALLGGLYSLRQLRSGHLARALEARHKHLGSALSNAVALQHAPSDSPITEHLRQQALGYGRDAAAAAPVWPLARASALSAAALALLLATCWLLAPILAPGVMAALWPRFSDPTGDHPPYSRLAFTVHSELPEVLYGGAVEVRAQVSGGAVDRLYLFAKGEGDAQEPSQSVMFRAPDGGYVQTLTNIREPLQIWVGDGRARSHRQQIGIVRTPQITLLEAELHFPEHTRRSSEHIVLGDEDLRLPRRSEIRLRVASNRPLQGGTLLAQAIDGSVSDHIPLVVDREHPHVVSASLSLDHSLTYEIRITDHDNLVNQHPQRGRLLVATDRPPRIHVLEPGRDAVSTPTMAIPVEVTARDDYGIAAVHWLRSVNGSIHDVGTMELSAINNDPARIQVLDAFDLNDLGLRPGDRIEYIFEAVDNDPDGPQIATSVPYVIDIISEEAYRAALRNEQQGARGVMDDYLNLAQTARRLAERARALADMADNAAAADDISSQLAAIAGDLERYTNQLEALAERAIDNPLLSALDERVAALVPGLDAAHEAMQSLAQAAPGAAQASAARELAEALADFAERTDAEVSEPARHIDRLNTLANTARALDTIIEEQLLIAQWSRRFLDDQQENERLARMQQTSLADQQQRVLDSLTAWIEDMQDAIDAVPDDPTYDQLLMQAHELRERVANAGVQPEQASASAYFAALEGDQGHLAALRAWQLLNQAKYGDDGTDLLQQLCEGAGECLNQLPGLGDLPGQAMGELFELLRGRGRGFGGPGEGSGYSSLSSNRAVYGPDTTGEQSGRGDTDSGQHQGSQVARRDHDGQDSDESPSNDSLGGVRLQPDVPFPLRYRRIVGDYFRAVAESNDQSPSGAW